MKRLGLGLVLVLCACDERPSAPPVSPPVAAPSVAVADPPPPAWAVSDAEQGGFIVATGSADGPQATPEQAVANARAELGRIRAVRVRSLTESATAEIQRGGAAGFATRFGDAVKTYSDSVLSGSEVVQRASQPIAAGTRWWVQVRIRADVLFPERRLSEVLAQPAGPARRQAMSEEALRCLAGDAYRREIAVLAARLAVSDGGGALEMMTLVDCLSQTGQGEEAWGLLTGMDSLLEGKPQAVFDRYEALYVQLAATASSAKQLAKHLVGLGQALARGRPIQPRVRQITGGYEASFTISGGPLQLIGLWVDDEDIAPISMPGAERPVSGAYSASFTWTGQPVPPRGRIVVLALPPHHPAVLAAAKLAGLSLVIPNRPGQIETWKTFFASLSLQPYEAGFLLDLEP